MPVSNANALIRSCASFEDFARAATTAPNTKVQSDWFERLTQLYLQTQTEYRTKLKNVWLLAEIPPKLRSRLRLPDRDEGIDLVAETREGEFWSIQSKYRSDEDRALNTRDLSKFSTLTFVTSKKFSLGIVVHTSNRPIQKLHLLGPEPEDVTEIGLARWLDLSKDDWRAIRAKIGGRLRKPRKRSPRPHQRTAVRKAKEHFKTKRAARGRLIMPCGTGKSLTAFWIAEALEAKRVLVAVPSLALISQGLKDWTREHLARGVEPEWLCVCSDDTADRDIDDVVANTYAMGIPTTTNASRIVAFLRKPARKPKIVFTTYQSSHLIAAAARKASARFDLAILDEAHKTVGDKKKRFATLLFDKKIQIKKRLFMTATERVLQGKNDDVLTMSDTANYGERFHELSFKAAIDAEIICDYQILTVAVSDQRVKKLIVENRLLSEKGREPSEREAAQLAAGIALKRVFSRHKAKHAISFHRSIEAADRFREQQDQLNRIPSLNPKTENFHVSSKKSVGERAKLMRAFESSRRSLITNARCLTEGVDIPAIDCVLFADPRRSKIDIVQAASRAMRNSPDKKQGYILLPLLVPTGMTFDEFAETTAFKEVSATLAQLSTMDERIAEHFRAVTQAKRASGKIVDIEGDVPVGMEVSFRDFAEAVQLQAWRKIGKLNWLPFNEACAFVRSLKLENGTAWAKYSNSGERPHDIPASPYAVYRNLGWISWPDWLGSAIGKRRGVYRPFEEARAFVRSLGLRNVARWNEYRKSDEKPHDIPTAPDVAYRDLGWIGLGDWLGTGIIAPQDRTYRPFKKARAFVRSLGLKNNAAWREYCMSGKKPHDLPSTPDHVYRERGWINWPDWLGTANRPFKKARAFVRSLGLKNTTAWREYFTSGKKPHDIPTAPDVAYRERGWINWPDWLGTKKQTKGRTSAPKKKSVPSSRR